MLYVVILAWDIALHFSKYATVFVGYRKDIESLHKNIMETQG